MTVLTSSRCQLPSCQPSGRDHRNPPCNPQLWSQPPSRPGATSSRTAAALTLLRSQVPVLSKRRLGSVQYLCFADTETKAFGRKGQPHVGCAHTRGTRKIYPSRQQESTVLAMNPQVSAESESSIERPDGRQSRVESSVSRPMDY
jgi:hypothetical protein